MDSSSFCLTEIPPIPHSPYATNQKIDDCAESAATNIISDSDTLKKFPQMECQITVDDSNMDMTYSSTDSDGDEMKIISDYSSLLPSPLLHLADSTCSPLSDYYPQQEELSSALQYKPRVCREGGDSTSLLGRPLCEICQLNPCNTCLVHHLSRHTDLCYTCASTHFAKGQLCPLCPNKIVYIYMYDDL